MAEGKVLQDAAIKWGVTLLGMLVVAGAVSIASQGTYSKEQVDEKNLIQDQRTAAEHKAIIETSRLERRVISTQLSNIAEDIAEIKEEVKKQ